MSGADDIHDRAFGAFVDAEPLSVPEVAVATGLPTEDVREALADLVEAGRLRRTAVRGVDVSQRKAAEAADVDLETPIVLYHRQPEALLSGIGTADGAGIDADADRIGRRLARMDVPGASGMMRNWRRDAVRAAYDHLLEHGPADSATIRAAVFPAHEAGFDDPDAWWACIRPRLARLPGVTVEDGQWRVRATGE